MAADQGWSHAKRQLQELSATEDPSALREGMTLRAEWRVVDRLGRKGEGQGNFTLERHDHAEGF
ncbi:MAG: hypothetical protein ACSLFC_11830 [Desulfuromonadales bacterium]